MRKTFVWILAALMVLAALPAAAQPVHLTLWHSMSEDAGLLLDSLIAEFNATAGKEAGIEVESVFQGQYSEAVNKMNSILVAGQTDTLPDVMQLDATGKVPYASAETAYTAEEAMRDHPETDMTKMLAPAMANWSLSGTQLGFPFATSTTVLYYNKTLLDTAGAAAPATLADIGALAGRLPEKTADGLDVTVYAHVPNTPTLCNWLGQMGSDLVNQHNGTEGTATALACMDNGALVSFLTEWKALYATGALADTAGSTDAFVAGQQAVMTGSTSNIASVLEKVGDRFELGVAPYPRVNDAAGSGATVSGSCLAMFDHGEERRQAAWTLVCWLTSAEIQARFAGGTGYLPANGDSVDSDAWKQLVAEHPQYQVGLDQLMQTPETMRSVTVGPSADFYYAIMNDISDMLEQDLSPEETADILQEDLEGLLTQYARANAQ
ncbi:MAG: extracellular solute-binding protein [Clostridia bacterium]|nr:extracellular solute-binding protein [Clostridia bacterium]